MITTTPADGSRSTSPGAPLPERVLEGRPTNATASYYQSRDGGLDAGVWTSEPGLWRCDYVADEASCVLEGVVELTPDGGAPRRYAAGATLVVPRGFVGTWRVIEPVRKFYVSCAGSPA